MKILIDKEIDLNEKDLLNTKSYAKSLTDIVLNSPIDQPFTIGLFGEWGSGKSSIVKTLSKDLEKVPDQKIKFIVYDAWKYSNDSFRRMFLLKVQNDLGLKQTEMMSSFYVNTNTDTEIKRTFNVPYLTLIVIGMLFFLGIFSLVGEPNKATVPLAIVFSMLGFLTNVFSKAFNEYKVTTQQPHLFAPEQFEACFNEMIGKALKKSSRFKQIVKFVTDKKDGDIDKIIIVIDNIDRCHKDIAYELLTNTKNFIGTGLDVIFLIPVDENALKKHIFKDESAESEEFLRKYFNVTIRIKPYKLTEIFDFASKINDENSLGLQADTINIIAKEYASNPRRIIQFYNNLQLELVLFKDKYGEQFIKDNEIAICKFLIIREEWNNEYMALCKSPETFFKDYNDLEKLTGNGNQNYRSFAESTFVSTRYLSYDVLQKILINSDNYDTLPASIIDSIKKETFDDFAIILADTGNSEKKVIDYLLFSLNKAIKNGLQTTAVPELLDQIYIYLTRFSELDKSYYGRLEGEIRKQIDLIISNVLDPIHLVAFSNSALKRGIPFMENAIIAYFKNFEYPSDQFLDSPLFELYEAYITHSDKNQLSLAKKAFPNYLNNVKLKDKVNKNLTPDKLESLYTSEIIEDFLIDSSLLTWNNTDEKQNWNWLAEHLPKQLQLLHPLLKDAERSINENLDGTASCIHLLNELFSISKNVNASLEFIGVIDSMNDRLFANRRRVNGSVTRFLEQPEGSDPVVINYLFECFRITRGSSNSASWIADYASFHGESSIKSLLAKLLKTHSEIITFSTLKPLIVTFTEIDEITNDILLYTLYQIEAEQAVYSDDEIKSHFNRMVIDLKADSTKSSLLIEHLKNERAKSILSALLVDTPEAEFQLLLPEIQEAAFDLITNEENISRYKTNFPVLLNIARNGSAIHIKGLINSIKSNLIDKIQSNATLNLIIQLKNIEKDDSADLMLFITQNKISTIGDKSLVKEVLVKLKSVAG